MWQWPLMLISLNLSLISFGTEFVRAESTSAGSTSLEEARYLLVNSKKAFQEGRFEESSIQLKRYLARYVGSPEYFEARLLLGRSLLGLKKFDSAIPYLKDSLTVLPLSDSESVEVRLELGDALLRTHEPHGAYLTALEIEKLNSHQPLNQEQKLKALLLKGRALVQNHKLEPAQLVLASLQKENLGVSPRLKAEIQNYQLTLKLHACSEFLTPVFFKQRINEQQIKDQYERQGLCILEAMNLYEPLLSSSHEEILSQATDSLQLSLKKYKTRIHQSLLPSQMREKSRTERSKYEAELRDLLAQEQTKKISDARSTIKLWKKAITSSAGKHVDQLLKTL